MLKRPCKALCSLAEFLQPAVDQHTRFRLPAPIEGHQFFSCSEIGMLVLGPESDSSDSLARAERHSICGYYGRDGMTMRLRRLRCLDLIVSV